MSEELESSVNIHTDDEQIESIDTADPNNVDFDAEKQAEKATENNENDNDNEATWWWDENTPGTGEKPEWFDDKKYKTIQDQAKGLPGLRKKLGEHDGAPDEYEVTIDEELQDAGIEVDKDDPLFDGFKKIAKETHMSQSAFNKFVNLYLENYKQSLPDSEEVQETLEKEVEEAGGFEALDQLAQWGENNLPEELQETFKENVTDAQTAKLFMYIRDNLSPKHNVPTQNSAAPKSRHELRELLNDPRVNTDPSYQKYVNEEYKKLLANS